MNYAEIDPVVRPMVMRSTLFAWPTLGAKLQAYNERRSVIVAGFQMVGRTAKRHHRARCAKFEKTAQLEIEAPAAKRKY
ncbi:MAG: hypothetical protein IPJ94_19675 [Chloroflexi bacterium]|nr:hypothetical protein [Chloroflexota bacterium]